jgi:uroporphyrinogen-III decarboxylase
MMQEPRGGYYTKHAVETEDDLGALEWYVERALEADLTRVEQYVREVNDKVGDMAALDVQWPMQPYELLCFPSTKDTALIVHDCPERARALMDRIVVLDGRLIQAVARGGADFVFLGGPAKEMISPTYYRNYLVPFSQQVSAMAHDNGLLVYSHICSPIEPFLTLGFFNRMGIDLFETLSPPPVGNVASLGDALGKVDETICTRGNIGLDVLLQADAGEVREQTLRLLDEARGRKHMMAASDYLLYDVPEENVHAMADAVRDWNGSTGLA